MFCMFSLDCLVTGPGPWAAPAGYCGSDLVDNNNITHVMRLALAIKSIRVMILIL